jgi:hypothetical protein
MRQLSLWGKLFWSRESLIWFSLFGLSFEDNIDQIRRVEQVSDAYHLEFGQDNAIVMYLVEAKPKPKQSA